MQLQPLGLIDRPGGGHGAVEVAGVHRVDMNGFKALLQRLDLPKTVFGDEGIVSPVDAAVEVALRLRVADEIDRSHLTAPLDQTLAPPLRGSWQPEGLTERVTKSH